MYTTDGTHDEFLGADERYGAFKLADDPLVIYDTSISRVLGVALRTAPEIEREQGANTEES